MGVPGFSTWFSRTACPQAFQEHHGKRFDHVFVDVASILHTVLRHARTTGHLHRMLYGELDRILYRYRPRKSMLIAIDGPAPLAKLLTQRHRRSAQGRKESRGKVSGLSSLGLTPGTQLMLDLEDSLAFYVSQRLETSWSHLHFELSGAGVAGEGEMKLLSRLLHPAVPAAAEDHIAVIGSDSDLYIMTLLQQHKGSVWILPESESPRKRASAKGGPKGFSLCALDRQWSKLPQVRGAASSAVARERLQALKADLAAIAILSNGNDYLPGLLNTALESRATGKGLWEVYLGMRCSPEWQDRRLVLSDGQSTSVDLAVLAELLSRHQQASNGRASAKRDGWVLRKPAPDAAAYLKGLEWVLDMYSKGSCGDYRYVYDAQSPTANDILQHVTAVRPAAQASLSYATRGPLIPAVCALALLPREQGRQHAPATLRPLMDAGSPIAALFETCEECERHIETVKAAEASLLQANQARQDLQMANAPADEIDQAYQHADRQRAAARAAANARLHHVLQAHPHRPFPIEQIEEAVAAIPDSDFPPAERRTLGFASSYIFWRAGDNDACCCPSCQGGLSKDGCDFAYAPPEPPSPGMRTFAADGLRRAPLPDVPLDSSRDSGSTVVAGCRCPTCWPINGLAAAPQPIVERRKVATSRRRRPSRSAAPAAASVSPPLHHLGMLGACSGRGYSSFTCHARVPDTRVWRSCHSGGGRRQAVEASRRPWPVAGPSLQARGRCSGAWRMLHIGKQALSVVHSLPRL